MINGSLASRYISTTIEEIDDELVIKLSVGKKEVEIGDELS